MAGQVQCPKCGGEQIAGAKAGFGLGKAAVGAVALGPVGLLGGLIGSKAVRVGCLACGHQWAPRASSGIAEDARRQYLRDGTSANLPAWVGILTVVTFLSGMLYFLLSL
ncbi:MAG: hypothetical protein Q8K82_13590 [Gemmatimonadaceae bacterium]|nr:hypothetical protein [Gemmatimonadaceae bacterium]